MPDTYRAAIIGCGSISRAHARGYLGCDRTELVAASDTHPKALAEFCDQFGVPSQYASFEEMLDEARPDIVSVCLWHGLHAPITVQVASHSKRVKAIICEKPMATTASEADAMIESCERNGVKLVIGHQRRFLSSWEEARALVESGAIGRPRLLLGKTRDGLLNWGTHVVDCMRWLMGDPEIEWVLGQVERKTDRYERGTRIEDLCVGLFGFTNGAQGLLEADIVHENIGSADGCTVYGSEGTLSLSERIVTLVNGTTGGVRQIEPAHRDPHIGQAEETVNWIEGRCEHRLAAANARKVLEVLLAIYESARIRERVFLPLKTRDQNPLDLLVESGQLPTQGERYDIREFLLRKD